MISAEKKKDKTATRIENGEENGMRGAKTKKMDEEEVTKVRKEVKMQRKKEVGTEQNELKEWDQKDIKR